MSKSTWGQPYPKTISVKKEKKPISKVRKNSGQAKLFGEIAKERSKQGKVYSQVSGELIENPNEWNFHHVLPKGSYPGFKLEKINIVIITDDEHFDVHNNVSKIKKDPRWKWYFELEQELKELYNKKNKAA